MSQYICRKRKISEIEDMEDSQAATKVSDSGYSNSSNNSRSRRSNSSKSTHSGSNSSGSSGYGGKPATSVSSGNQPSTSFEKHNKEKDTKKKKARAALIASVTQDECRPPDAMVVAVQSVQIEEIVDESPSLPGPPGQEDLGQLTALHTNHTDAVALNEVGALAAVELSDCLVVKHNQVTDKTIICSSFCDDGSPFNYGPFWCVVSMHDGVVMSTVPSVMAPLGFPRDLWIGRSFIDFVHPMDRNTFASQITRGLAVPNKVTSSDDERTVSSTGHIYCRMRRYRAFSTGYSVKENEVCYVPYRLKLSFKNMTDDYGKRIYLLIQGTPTPSYYTVPNEIIKRGMPFILRHSANGILEYIGPEAVAYLGYLPQDLKNKDALDLYHPEDLGYLLQVYGIIVKEGGMLKSEHFRMLAKNGDYVKLESEWSAFINPWSKKLEFVIGKHFVVEGPTNPDVFHSRDSQSPQPEEIIDSVTQIKADIVKLLNEVIVETTPTKPDKMVKSKRCQYLATFIDSITKDFRKDFRKDFCKDFDVHGNTEYGAYDKDLEMSVAISSTNDTTDGNSSTTETPLSYTQINYNETLQRYFDSYQSRSTSPKSEDGSSPALTSVVIGKHLYPKLISIMESSGMSNLERPRNAESPMVLGSDEGSNAGDLSNQGRLTESLISKHNIKMEKALVKKHRDHRCPKSDRTKTLKESQIKKMEHWARCNATFQPTGVSVVMDPEANVHSHASKRTSHDVHHGDPKHQCTSARQLRRHNSGHSNSPAAEPTTSGTPKPAASPAFKPEKPHPQLAILSTVPAVAAGIFPMFYVTTVAHTASANATGPIDVLATIPTPTVQCMMYPQPVFGSSVMYTPLPSQCLFPIPHTLMPQESTYIMPYGAPPTSTVTTTSYAAANSGAEESWLESHGASLKAEQGSSLTSVCSSSKNDGFTMPREPMPNISDNSLATLPPLSSPKSPDVTSEKENKKPKEGNEESTDSQSNYSSFYSSFFKTESGSAEENSDSKNKQMPCSSDAKDKVCEEGTPEEAPNPNNVNKRKMDPPWMEKVCFTSELIYKYQVHQRSMDDVLNDDKEKISNLIQPSLVNDQLKQLYLDLQLEGVAARLTLEEGITSSASSGEDSPNTTLTVPVPGRKATKKKIQYSKLAMIYEEDSMMPPPGED